MKRIYLNVLFFLSLFSVCLSTSAQYCSGVSVQVYEANPQSGPYNVYGVMATIQAEYTDDITISGYIYPSTDQNNNHQSFSITIVKGTLSASTGLFYQLGAGESADVMVESVSPCPEVTSWYAGVPIVYETANNLLRFNNLNDFNTVMDDLDAAYENWNQAYENNYPNLTPDQLDDIDDATGFDEFYEFRQFENMFAGFYSKRMEIENAETAWLNSDFATTDPESFDLTADDATNTVFNNNNSFKIGNDLYELTATGLYINGVLQIAGTDLHLPQREELAAIEPVAKDGLYSNINFPTQTALSGPSLLSDDFNILNNPGCKSNKKDWTDVPGTNEKWRLKVAINSWAIRSGVKAKVCHYKRKNSHWKKRRAKLAVYLTGMVYDNLCTHLFDFSDRSPSGGYKNRKQLKTARHAGAVIWRTQSNQVYASFEDAGGTTGLLYLAF
jgi:hypothetical protein